MSIADNGDPAVGRVPAVLVSLMLQAYLLLLTFLLLFDVYC